MGSYYRVSTHDVSPKDLYVNMDARQNLQNRYLNMAKTIFELKKNEEISRNVIYEIYHWYNFENFLNIVMPCGGLGIRSEQSACKLWPRKPTACQVHMLYKGTDWITFCMRTVLTGCNSSRRHPTGNTRERRWCEKTDDRQLHAVIACFRNEGIGL